MRTLWAGEAWPLKMNNLVVYTMPFDYDPSGERKQVTETYTQFIASVKKFMQESEEKEKEDKAASLKMLKTLVDTFKENDGISAEQKYKVAMSILIGYEQARKEAAETIKHRQGLLAEYEADLVNATVTNYTEQLVEYIG